MHSGPVCAPTHRCWLSTSATGGACACTVPEGREFAATGSSVETLTSTSMPGFSEASKLSWHLLGVGCVKVSAESSLVQPASQVHESLAEEASAMFHQGLKVSPSLEESSE